MIIASSRFAFGIGTVGCAGLLAAKLAGCAPIIAVDVFNERLALARTMLLTSTVSLQTEGATITLPGKNPLSVQGMISYQADLNRLLRWITDPRLPAKYALNGRLIGTADVAVSITGAAGLEGASFAVNRFAEQFLEQLDLGGILSLASRRMRPHRTRCGASTSPVIPRGSCPGIARFACCS
jgi:threonine dehydrogenase-like Zn-dependent dehydrogenase